MEYVIWVVLGLVVILGLYVVGVFNSLVQLRNRVKDQWSQIEVQLKRRFDLIPNLVETIKGYTTHESETLTAVIEARNKFVSASTPEEEMKASGDLSNVMSKLFALSEAYPDLKANKSFEDMQTTLKETEDKIAMTRQFYNDTVLTLNNKIEMFPSSIVASMFKFKKEAFFEASEKEKATPKVEF